MTKYILPMRTQLFFALTFWGESIAVNSVTSIRIFSRSFEISLSQSWCINIYIPEAYHRNNSRAVIQRLSVECLDFISENDGFVQQNLCVVVLLVKVLWHNKAAIVWLLKATKDTFYQSHIFDFLCKFSDFVFGRERIENGPLEVWMGEDNIFWLDPLYG